MEEKIKKEFNHAPNIETSNQTSTANYWMYNYKIQFYDNLDEKSCIKKGCVIATSTEDAFEKIKKYYIDKENELSNILIVEREFGEVNFSSLVIEEEKEEDWDF